MNKREIIAQTFSNMYNIYQDTGQIIRIIEEQMKNNGFQSLGNDAAVWETSTSFHKSDSWIYSWFARAYLDDKQSDKAVGFCIHLGKENYHEDGLDRLAEYGITFPFMNISLTGIDQEVTNIKKSVFYDVLWGAGWWTDIKQKLINNCQVYSEDEVAEVLAKSTTYFVDLLGLTNEEIIERLVTEPMSKMVEGDQQWVANAELPVIMIPENSYLETL